MASYAKRWQVIFLPYKANFRVLQYFSQLMFSVMGLCVTLILSTVLSILLSFLVLGPSTNETNTVMPLWQWR